MIFTPRLNNALAYRLHQNGVKRLMIISLEFDQAEIAWSFAEHLLISNLTAKPCASQRTGNGLLALFG